MTVGGVDENGNRSAVVELTTLNPIANPIQPCYEELNLFPRPVSDAAGGPIGKFKFISEKICPKINLIALMES